MSPERGDDFEPWLERELRQAVGSMRGPSPRADRAAYRAGSRAPRGPLALRSAVAVVVVTLGVVGGLTGVAAVTGGANPVSLGHRVMQVVTLAGHGATPSARPGEPAVDEVPGATTRPQPSGDREGTPEPIQSGVLRREYEKDQSDQGNQSQADQSGQAGQSTDAGQERRDHAKDRRDHPPSPTPNPNTRPQSSANS